MKLKRQLIYINILVGIFIITWSIAFADDLKKESTEQLEPSVSINNQARDSFVQIQQLTKEFWKLFPQDDIMEPEQQQFNNKDLDSAKERLRQIKCRRTKKCK